MKENYDRILEFILKWEGGKPHKVKGDKGGWTSYGGLTLSTMVSLNLDIDKDGDVDINDLYKVDKSIIDGAFRKEYWNKINGDSLPAGIDLIMADIAWNSGVMKAKQFALEGYIDTPEELTERRKRFYRYLAETTPGYEKFLKGWLNRADDALAEAKNLQWENPITDEAMRKFTE